MNIPRLVPTPTLHTLATGESIIYIATRLFDYTEKIKAEYIELAVTKGVDRAMQSIDIARTKNVRATFVPFRDTSQNVDDEPDPAIIDLNQTIHQEDKGRLDRSFALIGFFDGLSKDEGVCMEIGYAFGIKRPIILVISDFVRMNFKAIPKSEHLVDPVIEAMASKIIYQYNIPQINAPFREQLQAALDMLYQKVEEETFILCLESAKKIEGDAEQKPTPSPVEYDVCIDFGGGLYEWQRILQEQLAEELIRKGLSCTIGDRCSYYTNHTNDYVSIKELGWRDIIKVQSSKLLVTCSDSTEMSSGTAALQGYSCAIGKKILLYDSKTTNMIGDNHYKSSRNLMIDYSANRIVSKFADLSISVENLLRELR